MQNAFDQLDFFYTFGQLHPRLLGTNFVFYRISYEIRRFFVYDLLTQNDTRTLVKSR